MRHFSEGLAQHYNVFFAPAAEHYAEAAKADPGFALARFMHVRIESGPAFPERLARMNEVLTELTSASPEELLFALGIREQYAGNRETAHALYNTAANLAPGDPYLAHSAAFNKGPNWSPEQVVGLKEVTKEFPEFAPAHNHLAYALWRTGDKGGAVTAVKRYVELMPNHPNTHDSYAEIMQFRGMYDEAGKHYKKATELDKGYRAGYHGLADVYVLKGDYEAARGALWEAVQGDPSPASRVDAMRMEANIYLLEGKIEKGLSTLRAAAKKAEDEGEKARAAAAYRALAAAEAIVGDDAKIEEYVSRAEELGGQTPQQHAWAAYAFGTAGHARKAHQAAQALQEALGEANEWTQTSKALAYLAENNFPAAEEALLRSGLQNALSQAAMVRLKRQNGREAEAKLFEDDVRNFREASAFGSAKTLAVVSLTRN